MFANASFPAEPSPPPFSPPAIPLEILFKFCCNLRVCVLLGICDTSGGATYTTFFTTSLPCAVPTAACFIIGTLFTITDVFFQTNALSSSYSVPSCALVSTSSHA